ncbi:MAG: DsbA family protein [Gemmatimonadaceae bacterium]
MQRALPRAFSALALLALAACGSTETARGDTSAAAASAAPKDSATGGAPADEFLARVDRARIQGSESAPLWIVEVSDFQCPYCAEWHKTTYPQVKREFVNTGKVRFAYINLPLQTHRHAWPAAEAAMCAGAQGKFWEMHDAIFDAQLRWAPLDNAAVTFDSLAAGVGVDMAQFRECVTSRRTRPLVQADYERAVREAGVNSTPTFIIGTVIAQGAQPIETFRRVIESQLGAAAP